MGFLENVSSLNKTIYWCYQKAYPVNDRIKELLAKYRGFLVPINDFDDTMHLLGTEFGFNFSEDTIRKVTKARATNLVNKYKAWRKNRQKTLSSTIETLSDIESITFDSFKPISESNITKFESQIAEEPQNALYYYELGDEYYFNSEYSKAIEYYTKAIELDPNNADYHNWRGACFNEFEEYEKAIADFSKAIELDPNNEDLHNWRNKLLQ